MKKYCIIKTLKGQKGFVNTNIYFEKEEDADEVAMLLADKTKDEIYSYVRI